MEVLKLSSVIIYSSLLVPETFFPLVLSGRRTLEEKRLSPEETSVDAIHLGNLFRHQLTVKSIS